MSKEHTIHINSFLDEMGPLEDPEELSAALLNCAEKFEGKAKEYRRLSKFIQDKRVKVLACTGYPDVGSFSVDEIDRARLIKADLLKDYSELEEDPDSCFYIDSKYKGFDTQALELIAEGFTTDEQDIEYSEFSSSISEDDVEDFAQDIKENDLLDFEVDSEDTSPYFSNININNLIDHTVYIETICYDSENEVFTFSYPNEDIKFGRTLEEVIESLEGSMVILSSFAKHLDYNENLCLLLSHFAESLQLLKFKLDQEE